jgi:dipeptidyl-peptidase III
MVLNTDTDVSHRVRKNGPNDFTLLVASADPRPQAQHDIKNQEATAKLTVEYGDFAESLQKTVAALQEVTILVQIKNFMKYLIQYIFRLRSMQQTTIRLKWLKVTSHRMHCPLIHGVSSIRFRDFLNRFTTGSIPDHKEASKHWVKDVGPVVESYIGFIETYVDPYGGRAEWEGTLLYFSPQAWRENDFSPCYFSTGFTAIVNKQLSAKYEKLVSGAPELIKVLPWGKDFEVDIFRKPDFTALEIVSFATGGTFLLFKCLITWFTICSGIPAGINVRSPFTTN